MDGGIQKDITMPYTDIAKRVVTQSDTVKDFDLTYLVLQNGKKLQLQNGKLLTLKERPRSVYTDIPKA